MTASTTSLTEELSRLSAQYAQQLPPDIQAVMRDAEHELVNSGLADAGVRKGDQAPRFRLPNARGRDVELGVLLRMGPVVLSFYRGGWCPYCNLELKALQRALPEFQGHGASLVAVSPETPDRSLSTAEKHSLAFEVLSDRGNNVARQFGLVFQLPESLRPVYAKFGIDLPAHNGDGSFELPVPATYVIDPNGTIQYAFVNIDYKRRAEPSEIVSVLARLGAGR